MVSGTVSARSSTLLCSSRSFEILVWGWGLVMRETDTLGAQSATAEGVGGM